MVIAREGRRGRAWTASSRVVVGGIGILVRIQVTPMWAYYPVQRNIGGGGVRSVEGCPPPEGNQETGRVGE